MTLRTLHRSVGAPPRPVTRLHTEPQEWEQRLELNPCAIFAMRLNDCHLLCLRLSGSHNKFAVIIFLCCNFHGLVQIISFYLKFFRNRFLYCNFIFFHCHSSHDLPIRSVPQKFNETSVPQKLKLLSDFWSDIIVLWVFPPQLIFKLIHFFQ